MPKFLEWLELHKMIKLEEKKKETGSAAGSTGTAPNSSSNTFSGMLVVFTGVRNAAMEDAITNAGGKIGSGITGKTTLVVAKDTTENSSKLNTAREKGIPIMNIEDFGKKYGL